MVSNHTGTSLPKWTMAIALGTAGVVVGLGYLYLNSRKQKNTPQNPDKTSNGTTKSATDDLNNLTPIEKAQHFKTEGNNAFKVGKYDEAISHYNKAIELCPKDMTTDLSIFYQNRAAAYEHLKKWSSVKEDTTKALELNPSYVKALYRRAKAAEITNDLVQALEDITAVCILQNFQNQTTLIMADRVLRQLGTKHAKEAMQNKKPVMPSKYFIKVYFSTFMEDPILKYLVDDSKLTNDKNEKRGFARAVAALKEDKYDDIIAACTEEIDSSESDAQFKREAQLLRGTFYLLIGRHADAISDLQEVIENEDADIKMRTNALIKMAALNMQLEKSNQSIANFEQAYKLDPKNCDLYHHRAQVNLLLGNLQESRDDFAKAVELNPNHVVANAQKCYVEYRQAATEMNVSALQTAMNDFEKIIRKFPKYSECYALYAQILTDQQKYDKADEYFQKALEIDPENPTVFVQRAVLQLQWKSDVDGSTELINQALQLDAKCEYAYEALGSIEIQRGNLQRAVELFDNAIQLAKNETELTHLFSLRDAALAQQKISEKIGISPLANILKT